MTRRARRLAAIGRTGKLADWPMSRVDAWYVVQRRSKDAGLETATGNHSFRAIGISDYMENGGDINIAKRMAGHSNIKTTELYDRRWDGVSFSEIERGGFKSQSSSMKKFYYAMVAQDELDVTVRNQVSDVVEFVCEDLGLSQKPNVVWIRPVSKGEALDLLARNKPANKGTRQPAWSRELEQEIKEAFTPAEFSDEFWLRSDVPPHHLLYAAAHETRHIWQKKVDMSLFEEEERAEGDAYPYGYEVLKRFLASKDELTPEREVEINSKNKSARAWFLGRWPNGRYEVITA